MKTKVLYNLKDFNDWFADYLVLNEMHGVLEPSPLRYPANVHWEQEDPGIEFSYYKLYYHFTYDAYVDDININKKKEQSELIEL